MLLQLLQMISWFWSTFSAPVTWVLIVGAAAIIAAIVFTVVKAKKNKSSSVK
jgi:flagellar biosynthesis/type III secretory pathway M-ring protein FliF/YscJ